MRGASLRSGGRLLVEVFIQSYEKALEKVVLDLGAAADPLYADLEAQFFHS